MDIAPSFAGSKDKHKILDEFDYGPDRTIRFRVTCH